MVNDWMPTLASKLAEIDGIKAVYTPDNLPAGLVDFPAGVLMLAEGDFNDSLSGPKLGFHYLRFTLYRPAQILTEAYSALYPFVDLVRQKIAANLQLGGLTWAEGQGKFHHVLLGGAGRRAYEGPGALRYNDMELVGLRFNLEVKESDERIRVSP